MANFNYKKYLTENKLTQTTKLRAGILAEGQFSWMTQDTNQQIGSQEENMIPVYMYDNEGNSYYESNYDGYGEFGGVDYYELLDKMNGGDGDRSRGIDLAFEKIKTDSEVLYPALVTKPNFNWKSHDFTQQPKNDPNQSWYMEPEEEDYNGEDDYDYSNDYDDNEGDGYIDDNDSEYDTGVDEGKKEDKKSNKMKRSELKEKIKEMALAEMKMNEDTFAPTSQTDFLGEIEAMLNGDEDDDDYEYDDYDLDIEFKNAPDEAPYEDVLDIMKSYESASVLNDFKAEFSEGEPVKKKDYSRFAMTLIDDMSEVSFIQANWISMFDEEVYDKAGLNEADEEVAVDDTEVAADGEENIDVDTTTEVDPNVKAVQDALTQAQAAAQKLGDPKLTDQIGNTITFFTRAHVVEKGAVAEGEEMEDNRKILDQVRNELLGLFQPYGNFQISDMTMKGQNLGTEFRLYSKSKGADWKGLENFMKNNSDFSIKNISKQTFDNPKSIDFSYKKSSMMETKDLNENTSLSPVNLTKQNFDKIENSPLSKEYDEMFSILDNLISKYPEFKKKDIYDYFKLLAIDKYFNSGYLDRMWRKGAVAEGDLMKNIGKGLEYEATEEMIRDYADRLLGAGVDDVEDLANYYLSNPEELPEPMKYEFFKNNYDDILSVAMTGLSEGKKENKKEKDVAEDLNEAMFPLLKRILK
jgi:hypothetical protein